MAETMEMVLKQENFQTAVEVLAFLDELDQREQREFMNFLSGAKFVMGLKRTENRNVEKA